MTPKIVQGFMTAGGFIDEALLSAEKAISEREPRIGIIIKNPRLANDLREVAGQRSTILSRYAGTGIRLDDVSRDNLAQLTGEVSFAWARLRRLSRQAGDTPKIDQAISQIQSTFIEKGEPIYRLMSEAAIQGAPPPMDFLAWRGWTVKMLTEILAARDAPIEQALDDLTQLRDVALTRVQLTICGAVAILTALLGLAVFFERRILGPINLLTLKLDSQSTGALSDSDDVIAKFANRSDEIGALARALEARRQYEEKISHLARHDILTDLPNRALFREELHRQLANSSRTGKKVAVLCLDLDRFKPVNDTLGHAAGDKLLCMVADRLRNCVRDGDLPSRIGGDEFAIVQHAIETESDVRKLAARIMSSLLTPYEISGHKVVVGTSIGISIGDFDSDPDQLVHQADLALYRSKAEQRQSATFFEEEMDHRAQARLEIEMDLREAVDRGQLELHFQPIVKAQDGNLSSFEALVRWRHPTRGLVSPAEFIPIAEDTGLINQIGDWVLTEACQQALKWPENISVAVNVSPVQFKMPGLALKIIETLGKTGLAPGRLEIEVTEAAFLNDTSDTQSTLELLRGVGIQIALDDFGTGYSSLSYLDKFQFDKIKIDRSFIARMHDEGGSLAIIRAITTLARDLGISVIAEGVETQEQLDQLRLIKCPEVQGFLFSRPRPSSEFDTMITNSIFQKTA